MSRLRHKESARNRVCFRLPSLCRSGVWALAAVAMLGAGTAHAEWTALDMKYQSPGLQTVYVDPATIRRNGVLTTLTALIDWKGMQGTRPPNRYYSTVVTKQFDCGRKRVRRLAVTDFHGYMATGKPVVSYQEESRWQAVESGTLNEGLWNTACRRRGH